jgi:hypothetical protein
VLEFLPELFDTLKDEAYSLTESEAAIFLPCLIEKVPYIFFDWMHILITLFLFFAQNFI